MAVYSAPEACQYGIEVVLNSNLLKLFYGLKPIIPRSVQLKIRQARARKIFSQMEPPYLIGLEEEEGKLTPPEGYDCVVLLTHDVESAEGLKNIEALREIEREYDVPSTWNFVLKKYGDPSKYIDKLRAEGCECGAHGLYHDGKLFKDYNTYRRRMDEIVSISEKLGLEGFRSPALHRNKEWMQDLPFKWDSSFPAWDPFQPQPGGCRRYVPFKLNRKTWEFPVTVFQDFTIYTELRHSGSNIWRHQTEALAQKGYLINIITHPDYLVSEIAVMYNSCIEYLIYNGNMHITLPSLYVTILTSNGDCLCGS